MKQTILTCDICGGKDIRPLFEDNQFQFYCATCGNSGDCADSLLEASREWNKTIIRYEIEIEIPEDIAAHDIQIEYDNTLSEFSVGDFKECE